MSRIQFNQLFGLMMALAGCCAFLVPSRITDHLRLHVSGIFAPISYPSRSLARSMFGSVIGRPVGDARAAPDIISENQWLRNDVMSLQANIARLQRLEVESQKLGDLQSLCLRATVIGGDAGGRDTLILSPGVSSQINDNSPAIYEGGLAGRVNIGLAGARLRLITDTGVSITGKFVRIVNLRGTMVQTPIEALSPLVQGAGSGKLIIRDLKLQEVKDASLHVGDWVVLDDSEFPDALQGLRLGQVTEAHESRQAPGFVEIMVSPQSPLNRLPDVWVLKGKK